MYDALEAAFGPRAARARQLGRHGRHHDRRRTPRWRTGSACSRSTRAGRSCAASTRSRACARRTPSIVNVGSRGRHGRRARPRRLLRLQGRGDRVLARDGDRPRRRGHPRQLRLPGHDRLALDRPPGRRRRVARRRSRRASRSGGSARPTRSPRRSSTSPPTRPRSRPAARSSSTAA